MINSLGVKNYRNLKDLQIKSLGRVNLITGKNNVGKSALLEAIYTFVSEGEWGKILFLLENRGEFYQRRDSNDFETNLNIVSSLFHNREIDFFNERNIEIGELESIGNELHISSNFVSLSFKLFKYDDNKSEQLIIKYQEEEQDHADVERVLQIKTGSDSLNINLSRSLSRFPRYFYDESSKNIQFVSTQSFKNNTNAQLWDKIILTPKEDYVIKALQIIEPNLERLTFIADPIHRTGSKRIPVIKLKEKAEKVPLQSMGDGLNRILTMILNLVNAENGYFMIDEFENGLHYSVQEKLWEVVFSLAFELKIQVFATTHSRDCIEAFSEIVNSKEEYQDCQYIRLNLMKSGELKSTGYSPRELTLANKHNIETR